MWFSNKWNDFKIWLTTIKGMVISSIITTAILMMAIMLPIIFLGKGIQGDVNAYNRDGNSGTRDAFDSIILKRKDDERNSSNVLEVSGSSTMETRVSQDVKGIGYVSATQVLEINPSFPDSINKLPNKDNIEILNYNGIKPTYNNLTSTSNGYEAKRKFYTFFRVNHSEESSYGFNGTSWSFPTEVEVEWKAAYMFYVYLGCSSELQNEVPLMSQTSCITNLGNRMEMKNHLIDSSFNGKSINLWTAGSTSVVSTLDEAFIQFKSDFEEVNTNTTITKTSSHDGSGDAFKPNSELGSGSDTFHLGFQSRDPKEIEYSSSEWGYGSDLNAITTITGYEDEAIVIIVNTNNPATAKTETHSINQDALRVAYLFGDTLTWDVFKELISE